jgi:hypothetical protein
MSRLTRRLAAGLALAALLFAQLGVAAYACPAANAPEASMPVPCVEMDMERANLCDRHCHGEQQATPAAPLPPAFSAAFVAVLAPAAEASPLDVAPPGAARSISPPESIRHCRWRI